MGAASNGTLNKKCEPKQKSLSVIKEFQVRKSPLTVRLESNEDIRTIYNLVLVTLISLMTNTIIHDYSKTGVLHFGYRLIIGGFNKFHVLIAAWLGIYLVCCFSFVVFNIWAKIRTTLLPKYAKIWDKTWSMGVIVYYLGSMYLVQKFIFHVGFAPGSAAVLILEQVRLLMKQHSFIRTNAPRVLNHKVHSDKVLVLPSFQKFVYFSFAPTLLYRDEYPRTPYIRWKFVFFNLLEILGTLFLLSLIVERFLIPPYEEYGIRKFSKKEIIIPMLGNSFPGIIFVLCGFYSVLHSSQNAFAELLRFGDRMFYKEWWTSKSLSEYYRTWNVVVHDWLFAYIYKDMYDIVKNKYAAKLTVFLISAVVHEWVVSVALGLFFPIQFIQFFMAGALLSLLNILDMRVGNLVVWWCLVFGSGMQANLYALEFIARHNNPIGNGTWDFYMPRFLTCDCIE